VSVIEGRLVEDEDDAVVAWTELGGDVALKLSDPAVQHKSELGAVRLAVRDEAQVRSAYREVSALGASVLVERMAAPGVEMIVAARTDAVVPALVIGLGGVWTEVLDDVAIVPLPASAARIERALRSLRGAPLLTGGRGGTPVDVGAAALVAARVGEALIEADHELIELNPRPEGVGQRRSRRGRLVRRRRAAVGTIEQRDEIARRGWDRFVDGVREALPVPHEPRSRAAARSSADSGRL